MHILLLTQDGTTPGFVAAALATISRNDNVVTHRQSVQMARDVLIGTDPEVLTLPNILFVDYEFSRNHAHEPLRMLDANPNVPWMPIVVLSRGERTEEEFAEITGMNIACCIELPANAMEWLHRIFQCVSFWGKHVMLPMRRRNGGHS